MAILYIDEAYENIDEWLSLLRADLPDQDIRRWPEETGNPDEIDIAVIGQSPKGELHRFPNLKAILSIWAGVDRLTPDGVVPRTVPLGRLVDRSLRDDMTLYVLHWALHFHRDFHRYREQQHERTWRQLPYAETGERRIGVMGLGQLGSAAAQALRGVGFAVAGWDAVAKTLDGIECFAGRDRFDDFLARTDILVSLLPLTAETEGIIDAGTLAAMPRGSFIVSCARGAHVVDDDLLEALDSGQIQAAALDVFRTEPLPASHPFWSHPRIFLTPHVSAATNPRTAAEEIVTDVRRVLAGQPPRHLVDLDRGF